MNSQKQLETIPIAMQWLPDSIRRQPFPMTAALDFPKDMSSNDNSRRWIIFGDWTLLRCLKTGYRYLHGLNPPDVLPC